VERTRARSGWSIRQTLAVLEISVTSYYRWLREEAWARVMPPEPVTPVQAYEALPEEKEAVREYALQHPEIRHRELAWRMIDEDVAYVSSSTVYRILKEQQLIGPRRGRRKRYRDEHEKAQHPDQIWGTDIMYLKVEQMQYFFLAFIDEYSRYIVHWELLSSMDGLTITHAMQRALETLPCDEDGHLLVKPEIRSDNGSGYISRDFYQLLAHHELVHQRITPGCPEENGIMERANRTVREALEDLHLENRYQAEDTLSQIIRHYNQERLHSALGFVTPREVYRGQPERIYQARRLKMAQARHRRKQINLGIRQRTLPYETDDTVSSN
jgi:putative transposase